ncbi:uncharacterized protein BDV17DRAFT_290584 [Aspergillus undulatus]|uniref:uncharacterized protein n=1 Tax=Aspergillus undulatus TaxID=1810928 RepID=UPI003CCCF99B
MAVIARTQGQSSLQLEYYHVSRRKSRYCHGGARGIEAGIVRSLCKQSAKVIFRDFQDTKDQLSFAKIAFNYVSPSSKAAADSLVQGLHRDNKEAIAIQANVTDITAPSTIVQATLSAFKTDHIDNAGLGDNRTLEEVMLEIPRS